MEEASSTVLDDDSGQASVRSWGIVLAKDNFGTLYVTLTHDDEHPMPPAPLLVLRTAQTTRYVEAQNQRHKKRSDVRRHLFRVTLSELQVSGLAVQEADGRQIAFPGWATSPYVQPAHEAVRARVGRGIAAGEQLAERARDLRDALHALPVASFSLPDESREFVDMGVVRAQATIERLGDVRTRLQSGSRERRYRGNP